MKSKKNSYRMSSVGTPNQSGSKEEQNVLFYGTLKCPDLKGRKEAVEVQLRQVKFGA